MPPLVAALVETALLMLGAYGAGCVLGLAARSMALTVASGRRRAVNRQVSDRPSLQFAAALRDAARGALPGPAVGVPPTRAAVALARVAEVAERAPGLHDLTLLKGIGAHTARVLNELGIRSVEDVLALDEARIAEIEKRLGFRGRVARDGWIEQARWLVGKDEAA